jgi:hypothetical protein
MAEQKSIRIEHKQEWALLVVSFCIEGLFAEQSRSLFASSNQEWHHRLRVEVSPSVSLEGAADE